MQELKRVFTNRTFLLGLVLILVINAVMFYNEQMTQKNIDILEK